MTTAENKDMWARFSEAFTHAVLPQPEQETKKTAAIPKAMARARSLICIPDRWMQCSKKHQYEAGLAAVTKAVLENETNTATAPDVDCLAEFLPALVKAAKGLTTLIAQNPHLKALMTALVRKGFHTEGEGAPFDVTKHAHNGSQYDQLFNNLFTLPRRKKEVLALALYVMYSLCTKDEIGSAMTRIGDHMTVCQPGQQQGADYLFVVAGLKLDGGVIAARGAPEAPPREALQCKFETYFQEYLDDHKERALFSGVFEPVKFVFTALGNSAQADALDVHAQNWYLVAMIEALGEAAFPMLPVEDDYAQSAGTIHPYGNLFPHGVRAFQDPSNFGKGFGAIKALRNKAGFKKKNRVTHNQAEHRFGIFAKPVDIRVVFDAQRKNEGEATEPHVDIKHWAVMAEHLAFFFCQDFFVPKCFETLNGETKPEYVGFRQCCVELFQHYKKAPDFVKPQRPQADQDQDEEPEALDQDGEFYAHCYEDEYYTKLDLESVTRFFQWLGIVKPQGTYLPKPEEKPENVTLDEFEEEREEVFDSILDQEKQAANQFHMREAQGRLDAAALELKRHRRVYQNQRIAAKAARKASREARRTNATEDDLDDALPTGDLFLQPGEGGYGQTAFDGPGEEVKIVEEKDDVAHPPVAGGGNAVVEQEMAFARLQSAEVMLSPTAAVAWDRENTFEGEYDTAPAVVRFVSVQ